MYWGHKEPQSKAPDSALRNRYNYEFIFAMGLNLKYQTLSGLAGEQSF